MYVFLSCVMYVFLCCAKYLFLCYVIYVFICIHILFHVAFDVNNCVVCLCKCVLSRDYACVVTCMFLRIMPRKQVFLCCVMYVCVLFHVDHIVCGVI